LDASLEDSRLTGKRPEDQQLVVAGVLFIKKAPNKEIALTGI